MYPNGVTPYPVGPFGNMMPYTNFHALNQDWMVHQVWNQKMFMEHDLRPLISTMITDIELDTAFSYDDSTGTLIMTVGGVINA